MSVDARTEKFEHIELFGKPALFTNNRIIRDTVRAERAEQSERYRQGGHAVPPADQRGAELYVSGSDKGHFNHEFWAANPNAKVTLNVFCCVTGTLPGVGSESATTSAVTITLTCPIFNRLTVTTYASDSDTPLQTYTDPAQVVVPTGGKVVFALDEGMASTTDSFAWRKNDDSTDIPQDSEPTDYTRTILYSDLLDESGTFRPAEIYVLNVSANANSYWRLNTVKVKLVGSSVAMPQVTGLPETKYIDAGGSTSLSATVTNAADIEKAGGTLSYRWSIWDAATGEWAALLAQPTLSYLNLQMKEKGVSAKYKVTVTNTVTGEAPASTEATCTVTTRGLTIGFAGTPVEAVKGTAYDQPLTFEWVGEKLADSNVAWSGLPADSGYFVTGSPSGYRLISSDPKALSCTLTCTVTVGGSTTYTATLPLDIAPRTSPPA